MRALNRSLTVLVFVYAFFLVSRVLAVTIFVDAAAPGNMVQVAPGIYSTASTRSLLRGNTITGKFAPGYGSGGGLQAPRLTEAELSVTEGLPRDRQARGRMEPVLALMANGSARRADGCWKPEPAGGGEGSPAGVMGGTCAS